MNFGVNDASYLFTVSTKARSGQQKRKTSESMILYCLKGYTRNQWPLCKIIITNPDNQGIVRSVTLLLGVDDNNNRERILEQPISKLVLILEASHIDSPTMEA